MLLFLSPNHNAQWALLGPTECSGSDIVLVPETKTASSSCLEHPGPSEVRLPEVAMLGGSVNWETSREELLLMLSPMSDSV